MKQTKIRCFSLLLLMLAARSGAQEYNSVPLDHAAYDVIAMGVIRGIILAPPAAKPWPLCTVKEKLWAIIDDPAQILTSEESETVFNVLDSFERKTGLVLQDGRYRAEGGGFTFETGIGWKSDFFIRAPNASFANTNMLELYLGGDMVDLASWNINPQAYAGWPDDPAFNYGLEAELNGAFYDRRLMLRLGRIHRGWGHDSGEASLFINAHSRPFTALEGTFAPLSWLNISFLGGALERFGEEVLWPNDIPFTNVLSAAQIEFNPFMFIHLSIGGAAVLLKQPNMAFFTDLELRLPGMFTLWGSLFVDRLNSSTENFFSMSGNSYAYQAGIKTIVHWLPLAAFTLRYTRVEPYCYTGGKNHPDSAFINGGDSLGYLPPNSDELLLRFESMLLSSLKAHVQFQMIRHGVDYGYGAVSGSSLYDTLDDDHAVKNFLVDGVYQWDSTIKLGGSCSFRAGGIPFSIYTETGLVITNFTIGADNKADNKPLSDSVYRPDTYFVFSVGFRIFS
ncbi:MAG: hypothetical protein LBH20_01225 [Treponema sp.]|nr:hypothetical protein [Treponema sp.]